MAPEQKCVSLETAKRLKQAGFPQGTYFFYDEAYRFGDQFRLSHVTQSDEEQWYAAPDAQEVMALLPTFFKPRTGGLASQHKWFLTIRHCMDKNWVTLEDDCCHPPSDQLYSSHQHNNEAEARAETWLWLKTNNLL